MSGSDNQTIERRLSPGEALFIDRRRRGMTQARYARVHDAGVDQIHKWESDVAVRTPAGDDWPCPRVAVKWSDLTDAERCVILRRRAGMSRTQLAGKLDVSLQWVSAMERGSHSPARLIEFWGLT